MKRPLETEPGIGALDPRHLRAEGLESGQADNHALAGIHHFDELDAAALAQIWVTGAMAIADGVLAFARTVMRFMRCSRMRRFSRIGRPPG